MAMTMHASPLPTPTSSAPPTPPYPPFPRLPHSQSSSSTNLPGISRNASTSSSHSTATTASSTSSLAAAPIRPPPIETRTAATTSAQLPSRPGSSAGYSNQAGYNGVGDLSPSNSQNEWGNRAIRNGPRSRSTIPYSPPNTYQTLGSNTTPERSSTAPGQRETSPTTPRAPQWIPDQNGPRVTVSMEPTGMDEHPMAPSSVSSIATTRGQKITPLVMPRAIRGREGQWSTPSSPTDKKSPKAPKHRTLSVDGRQPEDIRERRTSQASAASGSSGKHKASMKDFILGEEIGRGSYSTVYRATDAPGSNSPTSPSMNRQLAIKVINQAHLIAEKKVKYAIIERDALVRLNTPSKGHRRGVSGSSSGQMPIASRRRSTASISSTQGGKRDISVPTSKDRLSVMSDTGSTTSNPNAPLSPTFSKSSFPGRRPSRSAEPPEMVPERSEENVVDFVNNTRSRPPSPVREESHEGHVTPTDESPRKKEGSPAITTAPPTPEPAKAQRSRRQSMAPSERSSKSVRAMSVAHPGVIRLHSTFNDHASLYFVLDLAENGELLTFIRKYGSLDIDSARFYAAQIIDTIEFMQERNIIHRDLKPENILLDDEMRIKITDFGSAKILGRDTENQDGGRKRSFVGSADFVSPEVLRSEPAGFPSDIWAFGCILYHILVGKPPFRGATDYLTFQRILKRDLQYPEDMDAEAQDLIDSALNIDPTSRPNATTLKQHPFFSSVDFSSIWQVTAPLIKTGLSKPVQTLAAVAPDSDLWAVFDDEVSDGGFEYDDAETPMSEGGERDLARQPQYDRKAAAEAVQFVDNPGDRRASNGSLVPPRPAFVEGDKKKGRKWSTGSRSVRTSSSSSNNRTALTGLLETMGIHSSGMNGTPSGTPRSHRTSKAGDEPREMRSTQAPVEPESKWSSLLLAKERVIYSTPISVRPNSSGATILPSFLLPAPKRRQLILTDFPRIIEIKDDNTNVRDDSPSPQGRIKFEAIFVKQPSENQPTAADYAAVGLASSAPGTTYPVAGAGGANRVMGVNERGNKGFVLTTSGSSILYTADSTEVRDHWMAAIKGVSF